MVRDALPTIIESMAWDGQRMIVRGHHFLMRIDRDGAIGGWDLFHPHGVKSYPDYARRRDHAITQGTFPPITGGTRWPLVA